MKEVTPKDLDEFLNNKTAKAEVETKPENPQAETTEQNPYLNEKGGLSNINEGINQGNNMLTGINELVKNVNNLWQNIEGTIIKGSKKKERQINNSNSQIGQPQPKNNKKLEFGDKITKKIDQSGIKWNKRARQVYKVFENMLKNVPENATAKQLLNQWKDQKKQSVKLLVKILKGEKIIKNEVVKNEQKKQKQEKEKGQDKTEKNGKETEKEKSNTD